MIRRSRFSRLITRTSTFLLLLFFSLLVLTYLHFYLFLNDDKIKQDWSIREIKYAPWDENDDLDPEPQLDYDAERLESLRTELNATWADEPLVWVPLDLADNNLGPVETKEESPPLYMLSAYYDTRPMLFGRRPSILMVGAVKWKSYNAGLNWWTKPDALACFVGRMKAGRDTHAKLVNDTVELENGIEPFYQAKLSIEVLPDHDDKEYASVYFTCHLTFIDHKTLAVMEGYEYYVTILPSVDSMDTMRVLKNRDTIEERWIRLKLMPEFPYPPIQIRHEGFSTKSFLSYYKQSEKVTRHEKIAVCMPPFSGEKHAETLRPWLEYYRMLGVDSFIAYNHSLTSPEMNSLLSDYKDAAIVDVVNLVAPTRLSGDVYVQLRNYARRFPTFLDKYVESLRPTEVIPRKSTGSHKTISEEEDMFLQLWKKWRDDWQRDRTRWLLALSRTVVRVESKFGWWKQEDSSNKPHQPQQKLPFAEPPALIPKVRWINGTRDVFSYKHLTLDESVPGHDDSLPLVIQFGVNFQGQIASTQECVLRTAGKYRWVQFIDPNEWIVPRELDQEPSRHLRQLIKNSVTDNRLEKNATRLVYAVGLSSASFCTGCSETFGENTSVLLTSMPNATFSAQVELSEAQEKTSLEAKYGKLGSTNHIKALSLPDCSQTTAVYAASLGASESEAYNRCLNMTAAAVKPMEQKLALGQPLSHLEVVSDYIDPSCLFSNSESQLTPRFNSPMPLPIHAVVREDSKGNTWKSSKFIVDPLLTWIMRPSHPIETTFRRYGPREDECRRAWWRNKFMNSFKRQRRGESIKLTFVSPTEDEHWLEIVSQLTMRWTRILKWILKRRLDLSTQETQDIMNVLLLFNGCHVENPSVANPDFSTSTTITPFVASTEALLHVYDEPFVSAGTSMTWQQKAKFTWMSKNACSKCHAAEPLLDFSFANRYGDLLLGRLTSTCRNLTEIQEEYPGNSVIVRNIE